MKSPPVEDIPDNVHAAIRDLITWLWTVEPAQRPVVGQALEHGAFQLISQRKYLLLEITPWGSGVGAPDGAPWWLKGLIKVLFLVLNETSRIKNLLPATSHKISSI